MRTITKVLLLSGIIFLTCNLTVSAEPVAPPDEQEMAPPGDQMMNAPQPPDGEMPAPNEGFITKIIEKIKDKDPNEAARLEKLQKEDPKQFRMEIRKYIRNHGGRPSPLTEQPIQGQGERQMGMMDKQGIRQHVQEKETELITWLDKNDPNKAKELKALKETDQRAYARRMMFEMRNYRGIIEAEQTNPALAEVLKKDMVLKQQRNDLIEQIRAATDEAKKKELTGQLKDVLGQRFDLIVQKKQLRYEDLKKKLEELQQNVKDSQAELENIKSKKAEQVEKHLQQLLTQTEQINWD